MVSEITSPVLQLHQRAFFVHVSPKLGGDCMASYIYGSRIASSVFPCTYCYDLAFICSYCFNNHIHIYNHISHFMHEMHYNIATLGHILTTMSTFSGFEACILDTLGHVYIHTWQRRGKGQSTVKQSQYRASCQFSQVCL